MLTETVRKLTLTVALTTFVLTATAARAEEVKVPQTVADHDALAKTYA
jgi:hypothetical protein